MSGVSSGYGWRVYGDESLVRVEYVGTADELIAAGLATAETLAPRPKRGKRPKRVDAQGIKCRVETGGSASGPTISIAATNSGGTCRPTAWRGAGLSQ